MVYHKPVLLKESVDGLDIREGGTYVDLTFGGGGHSAEILQRLKTGRLIAFDQDADAEAMAGEMNDSRFMFIRSNFRFFRNFLRYYKIDLVDGIIADLGLSSHHIDSPERGFSFKSGGHLDMRMNRSSAVTALDILNKYSVEELQKVFRSYGEVDNAGKVSRLIAESRGKRQFSDIGGFVDTISRCIRRKMRKNTLRRSFRPSA
jgi:16S rRNA (cytosine1402-N4)-methyltransferase